MDALKYAVTRFYGPSINSPRKSLFDSVITTKKSFGKLDQLSLGDTITITDSSGLKVYYYVYEIVPNVNPYDMSHIQQLNDRYKKDNSYYLRSTVGLTRLIVKATNL